MIDFDETGLYKGFVKNQKGKKFPGRNPQLLTLPEVDAFDSFSGVMYPNVVLIDADEESHNDILQNIIKGEGLACYMTNREGGRGVHVLMINSNTSLKKADKVMLACGIVVDFHPGYSLPGECLKFNGVERTPIYNKQPYQELPKYFTPLPKCSIDFANMGEGDGRNSTLYAYILSLQNAGFDEEDIKDTIRIINQYVLAEPLEEKELDVILRDEAFKKSVFFPKNKFSHDKFAEHIRRQYHVKKINGQLHIYEGGIYVPGYDAIERAMVSEISSLTSNQRNEVLKYLNVVCVEEGRTADLNLIAFKNGVYNLNSNSLEQFSPQHIITNKIPWNYMPDAYDELADKTLNKLSCHDSAIRSLLEECIGYCFYRRNELGKAFILTGDKSNGKSTFLDVLKHILGEGNTSALDLKELGDRFSTSMMFGKLANIGDDIGDDFLQGSQVSIFKKIVTGNRIKAERKGQDPFEFNPYIKLLFAANDIPRMKDKTGAVLRRLVIIPFNASFSKSNVDYDPFIKYKLIEQNSMEYMIQLGIAGLKRIIENDEFTKSEKVQGQLDEYEEENNPIIAFIADTGVSMIENEPTNEVYKRYQVFCADNSMTPMSNIVFSKQINKRLGLEINVTKLNGKTTRIFRKV